MIQSIPAQQSGLCLSKICMAFCVSGSALLYIALEPHASNHYHCNDHAKAQAQLFTGGQVPLIATSQGLIGSLETV